MKTEEMKEARVMCRMKIRDCCIDATVMITIGRFNLKLCRAGGD
jgi:hypothetical protein